MGGGHAGRVSTLTRKRSAGHHESYLEMELNCPPQTQKTKTGDRKESPSPRRRLWHKELIKNHRLDFVSIRKVQAQMRPFLGSEGKTCIYFHKHTAEKESS